MEEDEELFNVGVQEEKKKPKQLLLHSFLAPLPKPRTPTPSEVREIKKANDRERVERQKREAQLLNRCGELALKWGLPWGKDVEYKVSSNPIRKGAFGRKSLISKHEDDLYQAIRAIALGESQEPESAPSLTPSPTVVVPIVSTIDLATSSSSSSSVSNSLNANSLPTNEVDEAGGTETATRYQQPLSVMKRFFQLQKEMKMKESECVAYCNKHLRPLFCPLGNDLKYPTVQTWRLKTIPAKEKKLLEEAAKPNPKKGRAKRTHAIGDFTRHPNCRVSHGTLLQIASMVVSHSQAGLPLTRAIIQPLVVAYLDSVNENTWRPKQSWYYFFFRKIGLSWRRVSKAQRTLPDNFEEIKRTFLLRLVYVCALHHIPPELVVNADETGVLLVPCSKETFGEKGSDQVSLQGFGDKRQFTLLFGVSASGKFAGRFQLIWNTLPKQGVIDSFKEDVFHDVSESHWSVEDTIKNYVTKLHDDYIRPQIEQLSCRRTQKGILLWDVYYVHRLDSILEWVADTYPNCILLYVPASCTSMLQPLDVAVNSVLKRLGWLWKLRSNLTTA